MLLQRKMGFYEKYIKRLLDIICSLLFIIAFCWLYAIIAVIVRVKMGSPVLFKQPRPGIIKKGKETIFDMYDLTSTTPSFSQYTLIALFAACKVSFNALFS